MLCPHYIIAYVVPLLYYYICSALIILKSRKLCVTSAIERWECLSAKIILFTKLIVETECPLKQMFDAIKLSIIYVRVVSSLFIISRLIASCTCFT